MRKVAIVGTILLVLSGGAIALALKVRSEPRGSATRIVTLRKWTAPLLEEVGVGPGKCVFAVYGEIIEKGIFGATWNRTDGSLTDLRPKISDPTRMQQQ